MTEQRKRHDIYYLERLSGPILMHKDGSVGKLGEKKVDMTVRLPSRIEGQERIKRKTVSRLGEVALFAGLAECLADQRSLRSPRLPFGYDNTDWSLDDMPEATLKEYQEWCDRPLLDIGALRQAASEQATNWSERQDDLYVCHDCVGADPDYKYACRTCGFSRQLFTYPIVRYRDEQTAYDIPMDAAAIVGLRPESLSLKVRPYFNQAGMMVAERVLQFDAHELPDGYIPGFSSESELIIDQAEDLAQPLEIVIERWAEADERHRVSENVQARIHGPDEDAVSRGYYSSPEGCVQAMQTHIMQRLYHERRDSEQAAEHLNQLRKKVGEYGLELAYEYSYAGMGESEARLMLTRRHNDYIDMQPIVSDIDVQHGVETALKRFNQEA